MKTGVLRAGDSSPQRWKNDLGSTREIAVQPSTEAGVDFVWRVSIAEVDRSAPFSTFSGIDRHIALLDGDGLDMLIDRSHRHALTTPFEPFAFPGETRVTVTLHGDATRDFNLMVQRQFGIGQLLCVCSTGTFPLKASSVLIFAAQGCLDVDDDRLETGDSWRRADTNPVTISLAEGAVALHREHALP